MSRTSPIRTVALPAVESASVTRTWPNTITVTVVERRPLLAVRQPYGFLLVDKFGVGFQTSPSVPDGVSVVDANPRQPAAAHRPRRGGQGAARQAQLAGDHHPRDQPDDISLVLKSGVTVRWGNSSESKLKADIVTVLLKQHPRRAIDVSSPHNPTTR